MVSGPVRREQVVYAVERGLSLRRASALLSVARSSLRYKSRLRAKVAPALATLKACAAQFPRFGYRRLRVLLERGGLPTVASRGGPAGVDAERRVHVVARR